MTANELADAIEKGGKDGFYQDEIISILRQQQAEIEALHNLVKEQDKKIIDLAFDLAYANRTDEFRKELEKPVGSNWWKGDPTCGGIAENYMSKKASEK